MKNNLSNSSHQYYFSYLNNFALLLHPWICQSVCLQSQDCQTVKAVKASINVSNDSYKFYSSLVCYKRKVFTQNIYVYFHKKIISLACLLWVPKLDVILKYPHSLHRGQNPLHLWTTSPPSRIIGYPPIFRHFLTPSILWHLSLSLFVCKYFNLYKTLLWTYDEGCQGMEVLSIRQKKLMQFSLKYLFEKTKLCTTK